MLKRLCFVGTILSGLYIHQLKHKKKKYEKWCPVKYVKEKNKK